MGSFWIAEPLPLVDLEAEDAGRPAVVVIQPEAAVVALPVTTHDPIEPVDLGLRLEPLSKKSAARAIVGWGAKARSDASASNEIWLLPCFSEKLLASSSHRSATA